MQSPGSPKRATVTRLLSEMLNTQSFPRSAFSTLDCCWKLANELLSIYRPRPACVTEHSSKLRRRLAPLGQGMRVSKLPRTKTGFVPLTRRTRMPVIGGCRGSRIRAGKHRIILNLALTVGSSALRDAHARSVQFRM